MIKIKICGITNLEDALKIAELKPDALGFVFYKKSPRYISPEEAEAIIRQLPERIRKVGVFVNGREGRIKNIARRLKLNALQFHGAENPDFCGRFKSYKVIKALRIKNKNSLKNLEKYSVWGFLFDSYRKDLYGGSGRRFNWEIIRDINPQGRKIFLSGGLDNKNVKEAIKCVKPDWVDVSSSVEKRPGKKDYQKVKKFIFIVRSVRSFASNTLQT